MSGASQIYHEAIKALASAGFGHGQLPHPTGSAFLDNPLCGDCVEMQVVVAGGALTALAHEVKGCLLCRAAACVIAKTATGATLADAKRIAEHVARMLRDGEDPPSGWSELGVFTPVHGHASRYRCVELPFQALVAAMQASQ